MNTKIKDLKLAIPLCDYDVIVLTESWLNSRVADAEICVRGFTSFRSDRTELTSEKKKGGGVIVFVRKNLCSRVIKTNYNLVEHLFILIKQGSSQIIVGGVYIPPSSGAETYLHHCEAVEQICHDYSSACLLLCGDYNLPLAKWYNDEHGIRVDCPPGNHAEILAENFAFLSLNQLVSIPNSRNVYLDLIFSHIKSASVTTASDFLLPCSIHHSAYVCHINVMQTKPIHYKITYYDFRNSDLESLNNYLLSVQWDTIFLDKNINESTEIFYGILNEALTNFVPLKNYVSSNFPNYFSAELRSCIIDKKKAHRMFCESGSQIHYAQFSALRSQCKVLVQRDYALFLERSERSISENPRHFWSFVNTQRRSQELPNCMYYNDKVADCGQDIASLFCEYFLTVYSNSNVPIPNYRINNCIDFDLSAISLSSVFEKISHLPLKMSSGLDNVPEYLLSNLRFSISRPLWLLFNKSLAEGELPGIWKESFIVPVFKSGDRECVNSYRSITKQSAIPKLFDSIIYDQLSWKCKQFIDTHQHGFVRGRSTVSNLVSYETALLDALEGGSQVDAIYTDFSKAFDRVNHDLLVAKLRAIGFTEQSVRWFQSMLTGRTQKVRIGNFESGSIVVTSGVPQGGHCAPILFNLFLCDIGNYIENCDYLLYADDLKLFKIVDHIGDSESLQESLKSFAGWSQLNGLSLNVAKCSSISFFKHRKKYETTYRVGDRELSGVNEVKDLGIYFDSEITFGDHFRYITGKAFQMLGFIFRVGRDLSVSSLRLLYCSLVRSHLEYASVVWSPLYGIYKDQLERVQRKFIKFCAYKLDMTDRLEDVQLYLDLPSLEDRRRLSDLYFIYKIINGYIDCPHLLSQISLKIPSRSLRRSEIFSVTVHRTNYGSHSPLTRSLAWLNAHPAIDPFGGSLNRYRTSILRSQL